MGCPTDEEPERDGRDIFDPSSTVPERIIVAWSRLVSIRDRRWNMVIDSTGETDGGELYDLTADPAESKNVYDEHPEIVRQLKAFLESTCGRLPYEMKHTGDTRQAPPLWYRFRDDWEG